MDTNTKLLNFFQSKVFKIILICLAGLIILLLVFKMGAIIGLRKARFSMGWEQNYHRNFAGPRGGFLNDFREENFIEASGVFGKIIKIDASNIIIAGQNNTEKIVLIKDNTIVRRFRDTIKISDLKTDELVVVIGEPNETGQIEAKFIRIMPVPGENFEKPLPFPMPR